MGSFKRTCDTCGVPIIMMTTGDKKPDGKDKWMAWETDRLNHHNCHQPYYKDLESAEKRDESMAPTSSEEYNKQMAPKVEEVKKLIKSSMLEEIAASEVQVLITEVSKQTHLLNEILATETANNKALRNILDALKYERK